MAETEVKTPVEAEQQPAEEPQVKGAPKKRKVKRSVPHGQIHIHASFNNTIVTVTDQKGGALVAASCGSSGFKGAKKGTAYAAQVATEKAVTAAKQQFGLSKADVFIKGIGMGRESATRQLANSGISIDSITDVTGAPHGGTRPRGARRV